MIKKEEKMQVDDIKEDRIFLNIEKKMTCNEMNEGFSKVQNAETTSNTSKIENMEDSKFDGINLEDDIEKVELSSPELSDSSDDSDFPQNFHEFQQNLQSLNEQQLPNEELRNWLIKIKEMQNTIYKKMQTEQQQSNLVNILNGPIKNQTQQQTTANRVMKYQDLPYMGEITLDNTKPRRGRKPKKADICHLIYKNYGTILPGTPNPNNYLEQTKKEIQDKNKIISSLLERRLTQQDNKKIVKKNEVEKKPTNEPINLCVRDHNQLKIKITKNPDDTYSTTNIKKEEFTDDENESLNDEYGVPQFLLNENLDSPSKDDLDFWKNDENLQEQLLLYQKYALKTRPPPDIIPIINKRQPPEPPQQPKETKKLLVKIKPKENDKRNLGVLEKTSTKRKRSAIFIPPIPTESNANPATEVSICKFKFTGGAKPSLQEKKMLSVDSGGNFRYYSGTGDKSMRGYEFFPRETLQQTANATQCSSTGAFLQTSGEKFFPSNELNEKQVKSEFLLSPDIPSTSLVQKHQDLNNRHNHNHHKKRKSRKSIQREKLEKTFKEKGFLIQTQQLESAEGATYCKFRQLRKFTRYLFRSWKDYLPGNVGDIQENRNDLDMENLPNITNG